LSTQIDAYSGDRGRLRATDIAQAARKVAFRFLGTRVFPKLDLRALEASRITKILGALSRVRDANPISKGGADGGAVRAGWLDFRTKKQGAAGITTAAPYIAG
jgi:hypothetical protein